MLRYLTYMLGSLSFLLFFPDFSWAQETEKGPFDALQYRYVGPTRGGRVTTVAGVRSQPNTFYMGATGGGVWKTVDYGTSWKNISDGHFRSPSIGAIRVAPSDDKIVYVGTGSDGMRSNVIRGDGVYRSKDAGKNWTHIGLKESGHIGAIEVHPTDANVVFVAAIGQGFQKNAERGVFRSKDGGDNWEKVLFIADSVGAVDLEFAPDDPNRIYATVWRTERKPWTIISGSDQDGIYVSTDGGDSWNRLQKGLPKLMGKIDLAVSPVKPERLYALVEAPGEEGGLYVSENRGDTFALVSNKPVLRTRPFYYTNLEVDPKDPEVIHILATRYSKSTDGGKTWKNRSAPHGDHHDIWINPDNPELLVQSNDGGANVSHNGGKTWSTQFNQPTAELYQVEVDDQYPYWLYAGQQDNYTTVSVPSLPPNAHQLGSSGLIMNTGGCETGPAVPKPGKPHIVYANCKGRFTVFNKLTGQEKRYEVEAANMYGHNPRDLTLRFQRVSPIHVSPHDPDLIYHCSQFVHTSRDEGVTWERISPDLTAFTKETQVRSGFPITNDITGEEFYSTIYAIRESQLAQGVIWVGANDGPVHVTENGGKKWKKVTPKGLAPGGRVDCVEPSPHQRDKAYVTVLRYQLGDWKPYIYRTDNLGKNWTLLSGPDSGFPQDAPVRVVREDPGKEGILYAGTEWGLFISMDDGASWQSFQQNLPITPVTDIKVHRNDLVLSTMGRSFWILDNIHSLHQDMPLADDGEARLFAPKTTYRYRYRSGRGGMSQAPSYPAPGVIIDYYLPEGFEGPVVLDIQDEKGMVIMSFTQIEEKKKKKEKKEEEEKEEVRNMATNLVSPPAQPRLTAKAGLNRFRWDMRHWGAWDAKPTSAFRRGPYISPGTYTLSLGVSGKKYEQPVIIKADPKVLANGTTLAHMQQQEALCLELIALQSSAKKQAFKLQEQIKKLEKAEEELSKADQKKLTKLKEAHGALVQAKGNYTQPMLIAQMRYLYGIISQADQLPGQDVTARFATLQDSWAKWQQRYGRWLAEK